MREELVGLEVDYCFHLHTPPEARCRFTIVTVNLMEHEDVELVGENRSILLMGPTAIGYISEGEGRIKEGILYQHRGEELQIGGRSWTTWFQTGPRVYLPV
jgi:hypothetical protein